jgi:hypothetical protein
MKTDEPVFFFDKEKDQSYDPNVRERCRRFWVKAAAA